eukprot:CAMPEP_0194208356 /NCGR_PEP_ID=MMETSP0156-20130528/6828_1 /TAXON_ID=33649 /ORGANISM="Thalassionema nitzschioides, Strain L26-B" /LENGTH=227 /DNA_ID=CAMNT_0038935307 /DNA_START=267 /DNA_END=947 /DNA_ORIENTATION=+
MMEQQQQQQPLQEEEEDEHACCCSIGLEKSQGPLNNNRREFLIQTDSESSLNELDRRISRNMLDTNKRNNRRRLLQLQRMNHQDSSSCSTLDSSASVCRSDNDVRSNRRVTFSTVEYREYRMTVAHAGGRGGITYPLTLDWCYNDNTKIVDLRIYQQNNQNTKLLPITSQQRQQRLLANGVSRRELLALERRRRVQLAGEWAFFTDNNNKKQNKRPSCISNSMLEYA